MVRHLLPSPNTTKDNWNCKNIALYFHSSAIHQMHHFLLPCYLSFWFRYLVNYVCCGIVVLTLFSFLIVLLLLLLLVQICMSFFVKLFQQPKKKKGKKVRISIYMLSCCVFVFLIVVVFCVYCKKLFYPTIISISFNLTIQSSFYFLIESYF